MSQHGTEEQRFTPADLPWRAIFTYAACVTFFVGVMCFLFVNTVLFADGTAGPGDATREAHGFAVGMLGIPSGTLLGIWSGWHLNRLTNKQP